MKKTLVVVLIVFCYSSLYAQQIAYSASQWLEEQKERIKNSPFIFEGIVTSEKCYYDKNIRGIPYTCSVIQITKIFKGSPKLKLGSIKVITEGGYIKSTDSLIYAPPSDANIGGGLPLEIGHYIILGKLANFEPVDSNMIHSFITDNIITLTLTGIPIVFLGKDSARWDRPSYFTDSFYYYNTAGALYSFFKENGLSIQKEIVVPTDTIKH
jgi:hypothetical protein